MNERQAVQAAYGEMADYFDETSADESPSEPAQSRPAPVERFCEELESEADVLAAGGTLLVTEGGVEWTGSNPDWLNSGTEMRWSMAGPDATREDLEACGFDVRGVWDVPDPTTEDAEKPFFLADLS